VRIGIIAEWIGEDVGGIERYAVDLIGALLRVDRHNRYHIFVTPRGQRALRDVGERADIHATRLTSRWVNVPIGLPLAVRRHPVDVLHGTFTLVPWYPTRHRLLTVHDVAPDVHPEFFPPAVRWRFRWLMARGVRCAQRVLVPSQATRRELLAHYDVPEEKVAVIPIGVTPRFAAAPRRERPVRIAGRTLPPDCILAVGRLHVRKNLERVLQAFARVTARRADRPLLVLVGRDMLGDQRRILRAISRLGVEEDVWCPGHVSDADLAQLFAAARVFVFVSLHEGFGLPPLEAMAQGVPVIASNVSAMPEVLGDAALLVDPFDVEQIAAAMERVLSDAALAHELSARGREWVARYDWGTVARATLRLYEEVANAR